MHFVHFICYKISNIPFFAPIKSRQATQKMVVCLDLL